jgi:hypothetical protein
MTVPFDWRGGLATRGDGKCGAKSMTSFFAVDDISFFIVTQYLAGGLVDEMDPGAGRAGDRFITVRMVSRCLFRHLDLNIHASPHAAKNQSDHFSMLMRLYDLVR